MAGPQLPSTMKAWQYQNVRGGMDKAIKLNSAATMPKPKKDQHLIKVIAAALNPIDYKPAELPVVGWLAISKPATPGIDVAGTIVKPASGSSLKPGQIVYGASGTSPFAGGAMREYAIANAKNVTPLPAGLDPVDAATICVAGLTAYQSIVPHVKEGDSIFINGGSGGVGIFGIQFAKVAGCHITTTCSTPNVELCKSFGADEVVDYKKQNVLETLLKTRKFDHAVDNVGSDDELVWRSHEFVKAGSTFVVVGGGAVSLGHALETMKRAFLPKYLGGIKGKVTGFWPQQKPEDLAQIGEWIAEGKIKAVIDSTFPFEQVPEAIAKSKTGRARGKIVVKVASDAA